MVSVGKITISVLALLGLIIVPGKSIAAPTALWLKPTANSNHAEVWIVSEKPVSEIEVHVAGYNTNVKNSVADGGAPYAKRFALIPRGNRTPKRHPKQPSSVKLCYPGPQKNQNRCEMVPPLFIEDTFRNDQDDVWRDQGKWTSDWETLFSVWVQFLFRPLPNARNQGWRRLHVVLRNPNRNFLHNQLGYSEDDPNAPHHIRAAADCGDLPYLLRAYFAWKFSLPFRYSTCNRGTGQKGPTCGGDMDNRTARYRHVSHPVARMNAFMESVTWHVHSGTFRTLPDAQGSDFYPVALNRNAIRPGTVFVDPGGHVLMITQWNSEGLFAVDGHPDKTVTRRPFAPKYFPIYPKLTTGGFKAFRPFKRQQGKWVPTSNASLMPDYSPMQYRFTTKQAFYDAMYTLVKKQ